MPIHADVSELIQWPEGISDTLKSDLLGEAELIVASNESDLTGKADEGMLHVLSGTLTPCMLTDGVRTVTGVVFGKGGWFGNSQLSPTPHPHLQIEVIEPAKVLLFPSGSCQRLAAKGDEIYKLLWKVNSDLSARWLQAQLMNGESINSRLIYILLDIAAHQGSNSSCSFPIQISQFQLSTMTAISRSRVNEVLKQLEREQLISVSRSSIRINQFTALGSLLDGVDLSFRDPRKVIADPKSPV